MGPEREGDFRGEEGSGREAARTAAWAALALFDCISSSKSSSWRGTTLSWTNRKLRIGTPCLGEAHCLGKI